MNVSIGVDSSSDALAITADGFINSAMVSAWCRVALGRSTLQVDGIQLVRKQGREVQWIGISKRAWKQR